MFDESKVFDNPQLPEKEKKRRRAQIKRLTELDAALEDYLIMGTALSKSDAAVIQKLTKSDVFETQKVGIENVLKGIETNYMNALEGVAANDFISFCEYMDPTLPPAFHHRYVATKMMLVGQRKIKRLALSMGTGYAKSHYSSKMYPAFHFGHNPKHKIIGAGHTQGFVETEISRFIRDLIQTPQYRKIFPHIELRKDSTAMKQWSLTTGGTYLARGIGTKISGFRGHFGLLDDPYGSREDAESPTVRKKVNDWFLSDFLNRLLPGSPVFLISTRWNNYDLMNYIEQMNAAGAGIPWEIINLPVEAFDNDPLGRDVGDLLWPEFYTKKEVRLKKEEMPPRDWMSLFQGRPMNDHDSFIQMDWFTRYKEVPKNTEKGRQIRRITVSVDAANKANERNDPTCVTVWIEDLYKKHYLVECINKRVEFNGLVKLVNDTATKWKADAIIVEDEGAGVQFIQTQRPLSTIPIISIPVKKKSKEFRFDGVTPMFQAGMVLFPERATWLTDYETQLLQFPNAPNDDMVDSTSQYLAWARPKRKLGTKKLRGAAHA